MFNNVKKAIVLSSSAKKLKKLEKERSRVEGDPMISPFQTRNILNRLDKQESDIVVDVLSTMA